MIYKIKGIVINRRDVGEADKIITIFSKDEGKLKTYAQGIRWLLSKNAGHLELFSYSDLTLARSRSGLDKLATAAAINSFKNIRGDLNKTATSYFIAEIVDGLMPEKEKNGRVFDLLLTVLKLLDEDKNIQKSSLLLPYFIFNFLSLIGFRPEITCCLVCRKPLTPFKNFFSPRLGGLICSSCKNSDQKSIEISKDGVKLIRAMLNFPLPEAMRIKTNGKVLKEVKNISEEFLKYIAEKEFKSREFIEKIK